MECLYIYFTVPHSRYELSRCWALNTMARFGIQMVNKDAHVNVKKKWNVKAQPDGQNYSPSACHNSWQGAKDPGVCVLLCVCGHGAASENVTSLLIKTWSSIPTHPKFCLSAFTFPTTRLRFHLSHSAYFHHRKKDEYVYLLLIYIYLCGHSENTTF